MSSRSRDLTTSGGLRCLECNEYSNKAATCFLRMRNVRNEHMSMAEAIVEEEFVRSKMSSDDVDKVDVF